MQDKTLALKTARVQLSELERCLQDNTSALKTARVQSSELEALLQERASSTRHLRKESERAIHNCGRRCRHLEEKLETCLGMMARMRQVWILSYLLSSSSYLAH